MPALRQIVQSDIKFPGRNIRDGADIVHSSESHTVRQYYDDWPVE
jgi:hypothetical protein